MGSSRLPGKVLKLISEKPLLEHVIGRLVQLHHPATVVVATSKLERDKSISEWCTQNNALFFLGSEQDVLERYYTCAIQYKFDHIVRLTADNPFTDIVELNRLIDFHVNSNNDYSHSFGMLPIGVGAEVFRMSALRKSFFEGNQEHHREHVNEYILENPELFQIGILDNIPKKKHAATLRLTVDTEQDYDRACLLAKMSSSQWLETEEAIKLCSQFV